MNPNGIVREDLYQNRIRIARFLNVHGHLLRGHFLVEEVAQALEDCLHVAVNLKRIVLIDRKGFQALVEARNMCKRDGRLFKIIAWPKMGNTIRHETKAWMPDGEFTICSHKDEAIESFTQKR